MIKGINYKLLRMWYLKESNETNCLVEFKYLKKI